MWMVDPKLICTQHLRGVHVEAHMFAGTINKGKSIAGYLRNGLVEVHRLREYHDAVVEELTKRGRWNHKTPLPAFKEEVLGKVDAEANLKELARRCERCRKLQEV
jgi:hypothetical protein